MRVWRRQNHVKLEGRGCIESSPYIFFRPVWPAFLIARSMPVFDTHEALIFKDFLLLRHSMKLRFQNSRRTLSDHPDGIRVIPRSLYLRAFPRFLALLNRVGERGGFRANRRVEKQKNPRFPWVFLNRRLDASKLTW